MNDSKKGCAHRLYRADVDTAAWLVVGQIDCSMEGYSTALQSPEQVSSRVASPTPMQTVNKSSDNDKG